MAYKCEAQEHEHIVSMGLQHPNIYKYDYALFVAYMMGERCIINYIVYWPLWY